MKLKSLSAKMLFTIMALFALLTTVYAISYLLAIGQKDYGLMGRKQIELVANLLWYVTFYTHIAFGGAALCIGWMGFIKKLQQPKLQKIHRKLGKIYVFATFISSLTAIGIGVVAEGGIIAKLGFISLGSCWFYSTFIAYTAIRNRKIHLHQQMMVYSYAICFAAVTLRCWLPLLENYFHDFETAYKIVAWISWIPNLAVAHYIAKNTINPVA